MSEATAAPSPAANARPARKASAGALLVGAGILLSRLSGLVRQRVFGHYLGTGAAADAYTAAFRIPNILQNLLGEGVLSASFIPVYASLRSRGDEKSARAVAGAVAGLLGLAAGLFALVGMVLTPILLDLIAPGFTGDTRQLAIQLVRIFFPGISLLVLSAFCLGVLNSHRKFFLSYAAPVLMNAAIVVALLLGGARWRLGPFSLAVVTAWGAVAGAALQLAVQLPLVLKLLGGARAALGSVSLGRGNLDVRGVVASFFPVLAGRGVVQISAYVDTVIASWLPEGMMASLSYAAIIYTLPVSLFGMAISAAALPSMSAAQGDGQGDEARTSALRAQLREGLGHIAFPVVPSAVAFVALGDVICAALFQSGRFRAGDTRWVWAILAGSAVGLLAQTMGRLYSSTYYALRDTRTPLRFALVRVALTGALGVAASLWLPRALGVDQRWGAVGLTASAGVAGWVEFLLLRRGLRPKIGDVALELPLQGKLWASAMLAAAAALACDFLLRLGPRFFASPWPRAFVVLGSFGVVYLALTLLLRVKEAQALAARLKRLVRR